MSYYEFDKEGQYGKQEDQFETPYTDTKGQSYDGVDLGIEQDVPVDPKFKGYEALEAAYQSRHLSRIDYNQSLTSGW
eukprot:CAMPEP_0174278720 /NCGR_PEP_ID=MMETSP0439-20130205/61634_1 /TAXON_ID=0 /ORGANISM="Stereomyxa ramosa, Strain Chinc5" /LENGTH=76 /DNA_ID=CAMNT_0015371165 /DNA_START=907 /DNA_END=1134 /DNA_ORIENTATION=+